MKFLPNRVLASVYARLSPAQRQSVARLVESDYESITYHRLAEQGHKFGAIIDVGAYKGNWTRAAGKIFGDPLALMVEAQAALIPELQSFAATRDNLHCVHAALASSAGKEVQFHEMRTGSSMFPEASDVSRTTTTMTTRTLDAVVAENLPDAEDIFLKIDVQGAELEVLGGGENVLKACSLVQLEVALLQYNEGAPLLADVVTWMGKRGWKATEVSGFSRPLDRNLVQIDILFAQDKGPMRPNFFLYQKPAYP